MILILGTVCLLFDSRNLVSTANQNRRYKES